MAGNDIKKIGDSIRRGLGKAGGAAQKGWKDLEPKIRQGSTQVGRTASAAFEELGTSIRNFADRVRERSAGDEPSSAPADVTEAEVTDADVEPDDRN